MQEKDTQEGIESGDFLSPEDSEALLASMESEDDRFLGRKPEAWARGSESTDEGVFIYPGQGDPPDPPGPPPPLADLPRNGNPHTELLARIAREVHTIKAELGALAPLRAAERQGERQGDSSRLAGLTASTIPEGGAAGSGRPPLAVAPGPAEGRSMPEGAWEDTQKLLGYLDRLLESLPEEKVDEFVHSEYFELYRKVFDRFGLT